MCQWSPASQDCSSSESTHLSWGKCMQTEPHQIPSACFSLALREENRWQRKWFSEGHLKSSGWVFSQLSENINWSPERSKSPLAWLTPAAWTPCWLWGTSSWLCSLNAPLGRKGSMSSWNLIIPYLLGHCAYSKGLATVPIKITVLTLQNSVTRSMQFGPLGAFVLWIFSFLFSPNIIH